MPNTLKFLVQKNTLMRSLFFLFILFPLCSIAQHNLTVEVQDVASSNGSVCVALYDTDKAFLKFDKVYMKDSVAAQKGETSVTIKDIPAGTYALAVFHDENGNQELDTNWVGIPKEDVGFSNAKMKTFGPPSFKECAIDLKGDQHITVAIK